MCDTLADVGYEPHDDGRVVRMRNCPFHAVAAEHTELVCGMNLDVIDGLVQAHWIARRCRRNSIRRRDGAVSP